MTRRDRIDAVILAGGLGTRLQGVLPGLPKPLAPVGGRPFLDILLGALDRSGQVGRVVLAVGHMAEAIVSRYEAGAQFTFPISFSRETTPLGTGGAVRQALDGTSGPDVLVLNGDSYVEADLGGMRAAHERLAADATIAVVRLDNADRYGLVRMDADRRVTAFEEKRAGVGGGFVNAGLYLFRREVLETVPAGAVLSLEKELLPSILRRRVFGYPCAGRFIDIGLPESWREAQTYLEGLDG